MVGGYQNSLLTIFTIPKRFVGHNQIIQNNAIKSWGQVCPGCQVILLGDDEGTAEVAGELGLLHLPDVERNEYGIPLLNSMFDLAQGAAQYQLMCYINADILLLSDFLPAVRSVQRHPLLIVGQRWDLDILEPLNFNDEAWESDLRNRIAKSGKLHGRSGLDYFVYSRGLYDEIPPFAIGRTTWDNWLIYRARVRGAAVVDATGVITAIHQNHDYSHDTGGKTNVWKGPESKKNQELAGDGEQVLTLDHATWRLTHQGLKRATTPRDLYFRLGAMLVVSSHLRFLYKPFKVMTRLIISVRGKLGITSH